MKIGRWCFRHRRVVVASWVLAIVAVSALASIVGSEFRNDPEAPESESRTGLEVLDEHFDGFGTGQSGTIVYRAEQGVQTPAIRVAMEELFAFAEDITLAESGELGGDLLAPCPTSPPSSAP